MTRVKFRIFFVLEGIIVRHSYRRDSEMFTFKTDPFIVEFIKFLHPDFEDPILFFFFCVSVPGFIQWLQYPYLLDTKLFRKNLYKRNLFISKYSYKSKISYCLLWNKYYTIILVKMKYDVQFPIYFVFLSRGLISETGYTMRICQKTNLYTLHFYWF